METVTGCGMAKVLKYYWVPRLRRLNKKIVKSYHGCQGFRAQAFSSPPSGKLPKNRTEDKTTFQGIEVDFARSLRYRKKPNTEAKGLCLTVCL